MWYGIDSFNVNIICLYVRSYLYVYFMDEYTGCDTIVILFFSALDVKGMLFRWRHYMIAYNNSNCSYI